MKQSILYLSIFFAALMLYITSCSKKPVEIEEVVTSTQKFYYGGIPNVCDFDFQIFMTIDSLKKYCNRNNRLDDLLDTDNFLSAMPCQPASITGDNSITNNDTIDNETIWDFKISRSNDYQVEWRETPLSIQPVEVEIGFQERGKFPFTQFYKGYEVQISENQTMTILFFNYYIGGCIHDYYVWELVEN